MAEREVDLVIVGGGPAGLSAAVNAAYEGIDTLVIDGKSRFGGQAGQATWIENYAGFPEGISGYDLTTNMLDQGDRLNAKYRAPLRAQQIEKREDGGFIISDDTDVIVGRSVLLACGVDYRGHNARNLAVYLNRRGVRYGTPDRAAIYEDKKLIVVGGANSAGQAALTLAKMSKCEVHLLVRGPDLHAKMSAKVADQIDNTENIKVHTGTEITGANGANDADGKKHLTEITVKTGDEEYQMPADEVFLLIGAVPRTKWLPDTVAQDEAGFVCAGRQLDEKICRKFEEDCGRLPMDRETSVPGLFVAGDVRSNSVKRVASATGDGAIVIPEIYQHLNK